MTNFLLMTGPAEEPVTIAEARTFLRVDGDHDDAVIAACIVAARQACESFTRRALMTQTWQLYLDRWPAGPVTLPRPPLQAVTGIRVVDADGEAADLDPDGFVVDTGHAPARLIRRGSLLPRNPGRRLGGIEITFRAGYGDSWNHVPAPLRHGIVMAMAHFYDHRSGDGTNGSMPGPIAALWRAYRVLGL